MKKVLSITFFVLVVFSFFQMPKIHALENCVSDHLREAIELNQERKILYSKWTHGKSEKISNKLISLEKLSLNGSWWLDFSAHRYHENGIPIFCKDLLSMNLAPEFRYELRMPRRAFSGLKAPLDKSFVNELKKLSKNYEWSLLAELIVQKLDEMQEYPEYYCMTRHLLESIARSSNLMTNYERLAYQNQSRSPKKLMRFYIKAQSWYVDDVLELDQMASKLQEQGIPILCQDLPAISIHD